MGITYDSSRLQNFHDLSIHTLKARSMNGGFDSIYGIEIVFSELLGEFHEIALDEGDLVGEIGFGGISSCTVDLEFVVV